MTLHALLLQHGAIRLADVADTDRDALRSLIAQRLVMPQYGPGPDKVVLTRRGRVQLSGDSGELPAMKPTPPERWDF